MMKIVYLGPSPSVNVGGNPEPHFLDEVRDYPDAVAKDLLASKKQLFALADEKVPAPEPDNADEGNKEPAPAAKKGRK